jgi:hypothetical protein
VLIYNSRKEFVDATIDTLRRVGYNSISELQEDAVDFADLFENKPGFVHNFKNFSWIDFILHSEHDNTKARIRCNGKIYESSFKIDTHFFTPGDESDKGFAIELSDVIVVGDDENSKEREVNDDLSIQIPAHSEPDESSYSEPMSMPDLSMTDDEITPISMPDLDISPETPSFDAEEPTISPMDFDLDVMNDTPVDVAPIAPVDVAPIAPVDVAPTPAPTAPVADNSELFASLGLETSADYVYDPSISADELGLPTDLIDEFVGDFIVQAKKFRPDLEEAMNTPDFDNIQILSHKLKGVAANLRIEDALEVLTVINTSQDINKLKDHLTYLYQIVSRLEFGDEAPAPEVVTAPAAEMPSIEEQTPAVDNSLDLDIMPTFDEPANSEPMDISPSFDAPMDDALLDIMPTFDEPIENEPMDISPSFDAPMDDAPLDIMPLDMDIKPDTEPEAVEAKDENVEYDFSFDLLPSQDGELTSMDMDFDMPSISIEDEPFQSPQDDSALQMHDFDLDINEAVSPVDTPTAEAPSLLSHIDPSKFDVKEATESLDIPIETLKSYVDDFVDQANGMKAELEDALTSQNLAEVKELATQLIGMSDSLHMTYASELLTTLQTTEDSTAAIESAKELFVFIREL